MHISHTFVLNHILIVIEGVMLSSFVFHILHLSTSSYLLQAFWLSWHQVVFVFSSFLTSLFLILFNLVTLVSVFCLLRSFLFGLLFSLFFKYFHTMSSLILNPVPCSSSLSSTWCPIFSFYSVFYYTCSCSFWVDHLYSLH